MALFSRSALPHRCTLSRFLDALDPPTVEALRTLVQEDLVEASSIARASNGWSWMWMEPGKQPDNGHSHTHQICLPLIAVLMRSVLLDIWGANGEKSSEREPPCSKPIRISGWPRSEMQGTAITRGNFCGPEK